MNLLRHTRVPQRGITTHFDRTDSQYLISSAFPKRLREASSGTNLRPYTVGYWWYSDGVLQEMCAVFIGRTDVSNQHMMIGIQYYSSQGYPAMDSYDSAHQYERTGNYSNSGMWNYTIATIDPNTTSTIVHNGDWTNRGIDIAPLSPGYGTDATTRVAFGMRRDSSPGDAWDGRIVYPTIWEGNLDQIDILRLWSGVHPMEIDRSNIVFHAPMTGRSAWTDVIEGIQLAGGGGTSPPTTKAEPSHLPMLGARMRPGIWSVSYSATATNLTVDNLSQSTTVQKVAITTTYNATVKNLSQDSTVQKPTLTQLHILSADNLSQSTAVDKLTLVMESALAVDNLSQSSAVDKFSITQLHNLQVEDLSQSSTVTRPLLEAEGYLAVYSISQSNTVDHITTTKQSDVVTYSLQQQNTVDKLTFSGGLVNLTVDNLSQANTVSTLGVFIQYATLAPRTLSVVNTVTHLSLTSLHNLDVYDLVQSSTLDKVAVWANNNMTVEDLSQSNTITTTTFTQVHNLVIPGAYVNTTVESGVLWDWWFEVVDEIGAIAQEISMVGYIETSYEGTGYIRQTEEQNGLITQEVSEDGSIVQEYDVEGPITRAYEQVGEI